MAQNSTKERRPMPELIDVKRNPYLVDYEEQRRLREVTVPGAVGRRNPGARQAVRSQTMQRQSVGNRADVRAQYREENLQQRERQRVRRPIEGHPATAGRQAVGGSAQGYRQRQPLGQAKTPYSQGNSDLHRRSVQRNYPQNDNPRSRAAMAARKRRKRAMYQRLAVGIWAMCICLLVVVFFFWNGNTSAAQPMQQEKKEELENQDVAPDPEPETLVQGLPAAEYAKHPVWTENFLTPNEYSRPGDALTKVDNIFVHYTANPGTSAAQNRSYFEQQKDTHERSVSSHFIIGYEGEILQCVPLDEIAYAVATRNEDSISIECCFLAEDGSFTQETYDSLIALLVWLTDVYDLDAEDILRHYDCGGKKCPLYYTEHPDAWERLKEDVSDAKKL